MANVHGLRDLNAANNNNQGNNNQYRNLNPGQNDNIPFMNTMVGDQRPAMQQTIPYTLKIICCPDLRLFSVSLVMLLAMWILYIVCLTNGLSTQHHEVLEVPVNVLIDYGAAVGTLIKQGAVYRLITATFLHVNLLHIVMNSISLLIFVTRFQKIYPRHTPFVLLVASITGFMLSVLCNRTDATVGASTAIFGVLGGFIAYLIINWIALQRYGPIRSSLTCIIGIIVVFSLLFSIGSTIDGIAHIGGLVSGLLISLAILPGMQQRNKIIQWIGIGGITIMNLVIFLVFFLTD